MVMPSWYFVISMESKSICHRNFQQWLSYTCHMMGEFFILSWSRAEEGVLFSVYGDADTAVETRIRIGWNKFRQLVPLLTNKDISLTVRGRLYSSCVWRSMLHGSETWPTWKKNEVALQRADMKMVKWMCDVKLRDRVSSEGLNKRQGLDDIILVLQQNRLRWEHGVIKRQSVGEEMHGAWSWGCQAKR